MNKDTNSLEQILDKLQSKDFQTRHQVMKSIAEYREINAIPNLISLLNDKDRSIQISTGKALGEIGDSQAVPSLIEALLGDDEWELHMLRKHLDEEATCVRQQPYSRH